MFVYFLHLVHNFIMSQRKYTLPRHTNLAKQSNRTGAFFIDLAIALALTLAFMYGVFGLAFSKKTTELSNYIETEKLNSGLYVKNSDGIAERPQEGHKEMVEYYFLHYLPNRDVKEGLEGCKLSETPIKLDDGSEVMPKDYFIPSWYNKNVLNISNDPDSEFDKGLFTYVKKADGTYDPDQIGIKKEKSTQEEVDKYYHDKYVDTFVYNFQAIPYYDDWNAKLNFYYTIEFVASSVIAIIITYIIIPYFIKEGRTVGKRVFGLGLASSEGYTFDNRRLFLRAIPAVLVDLAFLIPIWESLFLVILVVLTIFLVSFALAMASPYKKSLHDFVASSIVIDMKTSIIFDNEVQEEKYLLKEDNIEVEPSSDGEEPELKYEK
mgnify:CR=1 FL=1